MNNIVHDNLYILFSMILKIYTNSLSTFDSPFSWNKDSKHKSI